MTDATEAYKSHLYNTIPALLEDARESTDSQFQQALDQSHGHLEQYNLHIQPLCRPIGDEELVITQQRGTAHEQRTRLTFEARMAMFKRVLSEEAATQVRLQRELQETNEMMLKLRAGMQEVPVDSEATSDSNGYAAVIAQLEAKFARKKQDRLAQFESDSQNLIKRMQTEEKIHARHAKRANEKFQKLLEATINEQDELAEE